MRRLRTTRRRWVLGTLGAALVVLAVGASQGLAGARADGSATVPVQYHNGNCGVDTGKKFIGSVTMTLKGTTLTVHMKLHGADPGNYVLHVHRGDTCDFVAAFDHFKVNAGGDGEGSGSIDVAGQGRSFFAEAAGGTNSDDSLIAKL